MNWVFVLFIIIAALILYLAHRASLFAPAKPVRREYPSLRIAYTTVRGAYKNSFKSNAAVEAYLTEKTGKDYQMEPCIGVYYDNPAEVKAEDCRALVGKIIPEGVDIEEDESRNIHVAEIKVSDSVTVEFPFRSVLAIFASIMRAYPVISKYMKENGLSHSAASIEFYGYPEGKLTFVTPIGEYSGILTEYPKPKSE